MNFIRNNKISFNKFWDTYCIKNERAYDNIRRSLIRHGGIRGNSSKQEYLYISYKKDEYKLVDEFKELCINNNVKMQDALKWLVKKCVENNSIHIG